MVIYEDECIGCPKDMGCVGKNCSKHNVPHYVCDDCEVEETLYEYDGCQLCKDCLLERFPIVKGSD